MNGGDGMIIFYEYLINEALRIVDLKGIMHFWSNIIQTNIK